ncbi:MAG: D-aminoacyl-tRNA deacylase [Limnochordales bacterium]|nr:D-tyrosyl-tRNA(Tyr) deacylase [Bacillota bacterium]
MRAVIQRVRSANVQVDGQVVGRIGRGLLVLLGVGQGDGEADAVFMADKVAGLRIFEDDQGKMNLAPADVGAEFLVVSQFTLYGDIRKGRRPSFTEAAPPERARELYERFLELLRARGFRVESGIFGAKMLVQLENDGPVTLWFDTAEALK